MAASPVPNIGDESGSPLRLIIQPLLASTCAHLIGQLVYNCQPPGLPKTKPKPISLIDPSKWYKSPLMLADSGDHFWRVLGRVKV